MVIQLIFTAREQTKADSLLRAICRLVPHTTAAYCDNGQLRVYTLETDAVKGGR